MKTELPSGVLKSIGPTRLQQIDFWIFDPRKHLWWDIMVRKIIYEVRKITCTTEHDENLNKQVELNK